MINFSNSQDVVIADDIQSVKILNKLAEDCPLIAYTPLDGYNEYDLPMKDNDLELLFQTHEMLGITGEDACIVREMIMPFGQNLISGGEFAAFDNVMKMEEFYLQIYKKFIKNKSTQNTRWIKYRLWLCRQTDVMFWSEDLEPFWFKTKTRKELRAEIEAVII